MEDLGILAAEKAGFFINGGVSHGKCEMGESPRQPWHLVSESSTEEVQQRQKRSRKAEIKWMRDGAGAGGWLRILEVSPVVCPAGEILPILLYFMDVEANGALFSTL